MRDRASAESCGRFPLDYGLPTLLHELAVLALDLPVDVLRRTRRNTYTIRGAAPDVTIGRPAAIRAGARPYQNAGAPDTKLLHMH